MNRRSFITAASVSALGCQLSAEKKPTSETIVTTLYNSLDDKQKAICCFNFNHALRSKVDNNWFITKKRIKDVFNKAQQTMIKEIFMSLHSKKYAKIIFDQVDTDNDGFDQCAIALFGTPGKGKFEFVFTGRHVTRRCDGDSLDGTAFGGPIFYGHAADGFRESKDHKGNAYWFQSITANKVYQALTDTQKKAALLEKPRKEKGNQTVQFSKKDFHGVACSTFNKEQKALVMNTLKDCLAPFRESDAKETLKLIEKKGGIDKLHIAFYANKYDIGRDKVWDVWQIESPDMIWFFKGYPHVHAWAYIKG